MKSITCIDDIKCFDGCMVAFTIDNFECTNALFYNASDLRYGVVRRVREKYELVCFTRTTMHNGYISPNLIDYHLKKFNIFMRAASIYEIEIIRNATLNNIVYNMTYPVTNWEEYKQNAKRFADV